MEDVRFKVRIKDTNIAHDLSTSPLKSPKNFDWVRDDQPPDQFTFVTDTELALWADHNAIAWLIEPPSVNPDIYYYASKNNKRFKYVLTYAKELLSRGDNFLFYPFGGTRLQEPQCKVHNKSKLISMILSDKQFTEGHKFRHACKDIIKDIADIYMPTGGEYIDKFDSCRDYMYTVVVENGVFNDYFTEKIIDSLLTGTIPIYNGTPNIVDYFDKDGIITFSNLNQLKSIVADISEDDYCKRKSSVISNYEKAKDFFIAEDWIWNKYRFLFNECK